VVSPYRQLFAAPGAVAFSAAGFVARAPMSMTAVGIVTMIAVLRGEYGLAGAVSACFTLAMALIGPQVSRLVDRLGQRRVLLPAAAVSVLALAGLVLCARHDAPVWTLFACAVLAGFMPNMAAMVRARWAELYRDSPRLRTALALESVVDEMTYVVGPALAVALSTMVFPAAGPVTAAAMLAVGVVLFVLQRRTEPPPHPRDTRARKSVVRSPGLIVLMLTLAAGGTIVGTVDVVSVAFAEDQGTPAAAGVVLSAYAVGSAVAGLTFGMLKLSMSLPRQLLAGVTGTAVMTLPMLFVDSVALLAVTVFVAGAFFAPTMIVVMGLVAELVPAAQLTEGMTWALTGLGIGVALGASVSGQILDSHGPDGGFVVALVAGAAALPGVLLGRRTLTGTPVGIVTS
jgi:MFS family permease